MLYIESDNVNDVYRKLINEVYTHGNLLKKENGITLKEIVPAMIKLTNPRCSIITHSGRPYNVAFMIAETLWNLSGDTSDWLCKYNKDYFQYYTDGKLNAGYGNRIFNQMGNQFFKVAEMLKNDKDTSHATISVFLSSEDLNDSKFVPCISFLEFRVIDGKLIMFSRMRAQDLWKGFPYDLNLLISLFIYMSDLTGYEMGEYYHDCRAVRLYEDDFEDVKLFLKIDEYQYAKPEKIDIPKCDKDLLILKNIISETTSFDFSIIEQQSSYLKNGVMACITYRLIHNKCYEEANNYLNKIDNTFKNQILIWSRRYYPSFYNWLKGKVKLT